MEERNIIDRMFIFVILSYVSHMPRASAATSITQPSIRVVSVFTTASCKCGRGEVLVLLDFLTTGVEVILFIPKSISPFHLGNYVFLGHRAKENKKKSYY